jgi:ketosteroid isomerase-like protein
VTSLYRAVNEGDLQSFIALMHPEVELETSGAYPDFRATYSGLSGAVDYWEEARGVWEEFSIEIERVETFDDGVVVLLHQRVKGRNGIVVEHDWGHVFSVLDGLVWRVRAYADWDEALEVAGLGSGARGE